MRTPWNTVAILGLLTCCIATAASSMVTLENEGHDQIPVITVTQWDFSLVSRATSDPGPHPIILVVYEDGSVWWQNAYFSATAPELEAFMEQMLAREEYRDNEQKRREASKRIFRQFPPGSTNDWEDRVLEARAKDPVLSQPRLSPSQVLRETRVPPREIARIMAELESGGFLDAERPSANTPSECLGVSIYINGEYRVLMGKWGTYL